MSKAKAKRRTPKQPQPAAPTPRRRSLFRAMPRHAVGAVGRLLTRDPKRLSKRYLMTAACWLAIASTLVLLALWQQTRPVWAMMLTDLHAVVAPGQSVTEHQAVIGWLLLVTMLILFVALPVLVGGLSSRRLYRSIQTGAPPQTWSLSIGYWILWVAMVSIAAAFFAPIAWGPEGWTLAPPLIVIGRPFPHGPTAQQWWLLGTTLAAVALLVVAIDQLGMLLTLQRSAPQIADEAGMRRERAGLFAVVLLVPILTALAMAYMLGHWSGTEWPEASEMPVDWIPALISALLLIAVSSALTVACRPSRSAKLWIAIAQGFGLCFLALQVHTYQATAAIGLSPTALGSMLFDRSDLYYVKAARGRLKLLADQLDIQKTEHPDQFTDKQAKRLELVEQLQRDMVTWSEQQVARWLDDTNQRRAVLLVMAYQVYPLDRDRKRVEDLAAMEQERLDQAKRWLVPCESFCRARVARYKKPAPAGAKDAANSQASQVHGPSTTKPSQSVEHGEPLPRHIMDQTDAEGRRMIQSILPRTHDARSANDALTLVRDRLKRIDQRRRFVRQHLDPILTDSPTRGLNARHAWLQLPIRIPGGRRWLTAWYFLLGFHALLVLCALLALAWWLINSRSAATGDVRRVAWFWHLTALIGLVILAALYLA